MEHQWRPMLPPPPPSQASICPICSISHFPFCPPPPPPPFPPYNQNPRFPPYPDYPPPDPYDSSNPSYGGYNNFDFRDGFGWQQQQVYDFYNNDNNGVVDRRYKRARVSVDCEVNDHLHSTTTMTSLDNERRLKLIRDHGGTSSNYMGPDQNSNVMSRNNNSNNAVDINSNQFEYLADRDRNQNQDGFSDHHPPSYMKPEIFNNINYHQGGYFPPRTPQEIRVSSGYHQQQSPPPPIPVDPPPPPPPPPPSLFPIPVTSSSTNVYLHSKPSTTFLKEEWQTSSMTNQLSPDKPTVIDAFRLFKQPYRATRPDHLVIILRGLPGSGKSYLAKMMRDLEVENGGNVPRIHSMDDYFMTEVEKVEESDVSKFSSIRGKKPSVKKVMEYCYEPEMEEAYRDSMLKAFKKTLEEGIFTLVIVDDRNLRVADFAQFWAIAKRTCYEVYISESTYKDPAGCAARNVHGFTLDEIKRMAGEWEEAPTLYLQLDVKSLFHGDDLKESGIQEVDMDTEDETSDDNPSEPQEQKAEKMGAIPLEDDASHVPAEDGKIWNEEDHLKGGGKELLKSKWSDDVDEDDTEGSEGVKYNVNALSGLIQAYGKQGKSVHWSDQVGSTGFSIGGTKKTNKSLVIGPGAGYNSKSNPLPEERTLKSSYGTGESKRQSVFQERLRAERESFKAVFDKRRRRIGDLEDE